MRRAFPFLIAAIAVVVAVAPVAQGNRVDKVATLAAKVKALQAKVAALESKSAAANGDLAAAKNDIASVRSDVVAGQQAVAGVQSGVSALRSDLTAVQANLGALKTCVMYKAMPIGQYDGYVWTPNGTTFSATTALDVVPSGQTPDAHALVANPSCVNSAFVLRPAGRLRVGTR